MPFRLLQIAYNQETSVPPSPDFQILDNLENARPEWYELWPMLRYLEENELGDDCWLGFFSPKFFMKTGWSGSNIKDFILRQSNQCEVALFSQAWDQIAYFRNVFEQGEYWHPGLTDLSNEVFKLIGLNVDTKALVNHTGNACFSNFIVAKPAYWSTWAHYAHRLFEVVENNETSIGRNLRAETTYGGAERLAPIRTFIQERLHAILLSRVSSQVVTYERTMENPPFDRLFEVSDQNRLKLQLCDIHKRLYTTTQDQRYLDEFYSIRKTIKTREPIVK